MFFREEPTKRPEGELGDELEETGITTGLDSLFAEESSMTLKTSSGEESLKTSIFLELPMSVASAGAGVDELVTVVVVVFVEVDESEEAGGVGELEGAEGVDEEGVDGEGSEELLVVVVVVVDEELEVSDPAPIFFSSSAVYELSEEFELGAEDEEVEITVVFEVEVEEEESPIENPAGFP